MVQADPPSSKEKKKKKKKKHTLNTLQKRIYLKQYQKFTELM